VERLWQGERLQLQAEPVSIENRKRTKGVRLRSIHLVGRHLFQYREARFSPRARKDRIYGFCTTIG